MGPQLFAAENRDASTTSPTSSKLQWGRSCSLRKTYLQAQMKPGILVCFNGAAAVRCGKPPQSGTDAFCVDASMGPQLFAAENDLKYTHLRNANLASMGPQLFAAENVLGDGPIYVTMYASMGPQLFAAENIHTRELFLARDLASMGPQLFAAENRSPGCADQ